MSWPAVEWMNRAECARRDAERPAGAPRFTEWKPADQLPVCLGGCPVRLECLGYALALEADGDAVTSAHAVVYGGTTGWERAQLKRAAVGA